MRVLVTGASGRVGSAVVPELAEHGHHVCALDNRPISPDVRRERVSVLYADITDTLAMLSVCAGFDAVVHIAAYPSPGRLTSAELLRVNVLGTQNMLDAAVANGIPKVVLTSSVSALGFSFPTHPCLPDYLPVDLAHPRRPQDIYGVSKLMNEEGAAAMSRKTGLTTIVLRPPAVFDLEKAKADGWLPRMVERSKEHRHDSLWAYIDERDLARAYRLAVESSLTGHHVFYAMTDDVSADATPAELAARHLPDLAAQAECLPGNGFYDLSATREHLGFEAERTWRKIMEQS